MSASNRANLLTKAFKILKKHYQPVAPPADRTVLEHILYACCLENSRHEQVDEVLARLQQNYFDWNEVRVTTVTELSEEMRSLADPVESASRLKRTLHQIFETHYTFDLEFLKKQNLGKATKELEKLSGVTSFTVAYAVQHALGGHSIPIGKSGFATLVVLGVISEAEAGKQKVPGLERAIPKTKGVEFGSLFHQLAVDFGASPHSTKVRNLLVEIAPDAKDRFPKRSSGKSASVAKSAKPKTSTKAGGEGKAKKAKKKSAESSTSKKKSTTKRLARKKPR